MIFIIVSRLWQAESNRLNAFKTISMRIRSAKSELEEAGESTDGMVESTATLREEIKALSGVDIMASATEFKSTYQILDELADKWENLSDITRATIIEKIAGKHQGNIFSSLMENFDTAREVLEASENSAGSAMEEHAKWSESLEARLNKLSATWQSLSQTVMSSDLLKGGIDLLTGFVDVLDVLINKIGVIPTLLGAFSLGKVGKSLLSFRKDIKSVSDAVYVLQGTFPSLSKTLTSLIGILPKVKTAFINAFLSSGGGEIGLFAGLISGLKTGFSALISMLNPVTVVITAIAATIGGIVYFSNKQKKEIEELSQKVSEVTTQYKEQTEELRKNQSSFKTLASRYVELSKGVDDAGRNISLTTEEYSEYLDVVNDIGNQIPSLVKGYDSQGNAILEATDGVNGLTVAYEKLIEAQNKELLYAGEDGIGIEDIEKNFDNKMKEFDGKGSGKNEIGIDSINRLEEALNGKYSKAEIEELFDDSSSVVDVVDALKEEGLAQDVHWYSGYDAYWDAIADAIKTDPDKVREIINNFKSDFEGVSDEIKEGAQAALSNAIDFSFSEHYDMSDELKTLAQQVVGGLTAEDWQSIRESGIGVEEYVDSIVDTFAKLEESGKAKTFETAFNLKTQFNNGEVGYGEYVDGVRDAADLIDELVNDGTINSEVAGQIKLALNTDKVEEDYNALKKRLETTGFAKDADSFLKNLTASEYAVALDLIVKNGLDLSQFKFDIDSLREYIEKQAKIEEALNFTINIEAETAGIESLNTALAESKSAIGLTSESISSIESRYKDLDGYNAATLFEETANGIRLNSTELSKLEKEYKDFNKQKTEETLKTLKKEYDRLTNEINNCTDDQEKLNSLYSDRDAILNQINDTATLAAQYEGLTSAYKEWQSAQEAGQDRDMYESILSGKEDIEDEMSRGWLDDAAIEYLELLSGKELSTVGIDAQIAAYKELGNTIGKSGYSIWDFFTKDEDGNSTSDGVYNFFDTVKSVAGETAAWVDENGKYHFDFEGFKYEGEVGDAAIAKMLGTSEELVQIILKAAEDAGFVINIKGDYTDLANLKTEAEAANDRMKELGATTYTFDFNSSSIDDLNEQIGEAETMLSNLKNKDGTLKVGVSKEDYRQAQYILEALISQRQLLERPAIMDIEIPFKEAESDIGKATKAVQDLQTNLWELEKSGCDPNINSENIRVEIGNIITELDKLEKSDPEIYAKLGLDDTEIANLKTAISNIQTSINTGVELNEDDLSIVKSTIQGIDANAIVNYLSGEQDPAEETEAPVNYILGTQEPPTEQSATVNYILGTQASPMPKSVPINYVLQANGTANVSGTAQSDRAFSRGDWGIKGNGTALVGELGAETLVRDGHYYTIGDNGAEFIKYRQGDIIFNHKQTEELFKNGKVTSGGGRGRALAEGTAFAIGSNASGLGRGAISTIARIARDNKEVKIETETTIDNDSASNGNGTDRDTINSALKNSSSSSSSSSSEDKFEESVDWIEVAISRIERAIDQLDKKANNIYKSWSSRNSALTSEISKVGDEIDLQQQAYDEYIKEANSVGLSESYAKKVREGTIDIEDFEGENDETLVEKINDYKNWYEKALACEDAIEDLKEAESSLYAQRFENIQTQYDAILQGYEHTETMLNEYISQAEAKGHIVSKQYYNALIENEKSNIAELKKEQAALIAERDNAVADGKIVKGSEAWLEQCAAIDEVTQAIEEGNTALIEYGNSIRDIEWETFDLIQERISAITEEADFLIELMSNEKLFDDKGKLTGQGVATMALHAQNYNTHMYQADDNAKEIADIDKQLAKEYSKTLVDRRNELLESQKEHILAAEDEKNAIRDLVEEGINLELDALQELIDKKNEELESERDLYEYQKKVKEQTEEIASLEKQMAAYSGDDSEEAKQKIQQIKVNLETAREDLKETEWDKYIDDTSAILDTLYNEYELILNQRLDNIDYLLQQVIDGVNATMGVDGTIDTALGENGAIATAIASAVGENGSIQDILNKEVTSVGTALSTTMNNIWSVGDGSAKSVLTTYGKDFQSKQTTTNDALNSIKADVTAMVDDVDKDAQKNVTANKTSTSAKKDPTETTTFNKTTTNKTTQTKTTSSGDGKPKVGDKVKFVSGQYYYDSQGAKPLGSKYQGKEVYITAVNTKSWATHPYHISTGSKMGKGDLGWLKLDQLSGYAVGKKNFLDDEIAWTQENGREFIVRPSDGAILTPIAKGDSVLTSTASNNIWDMANSPAEFIRDNLNLGTVSAPNNSVVQSNYTQHLDKVVFNLPNVKNYDELLAAMQKDKNFERLILSMSIDRLAGKSSLAKGKSIR